MSRAILQRTGNHANRLLLVIMVLAAFIGAFISNTASTALFIPVVIGIARRTRISPSRLLMPLAFASILSSSVTLVSTSTNIVVSGLMTWNALAPMGMFELAPVGVPITVIGLVYMFFLGRRLIPERGEVSEEGDDYGLQTFLTEVVVMPGSPLIGKTLEESRLGQDLDLNVLRVLRNKNRYLQAQAGLRLSEGDVLLVEGQRDEILSVKSTAGIDIRADAELSDPGLQTEDMRLVEAILLVRSPLIGRTLKGVRFRERYGLQVLAINRGGETLRRKISRIRLRVGDMLLIQGHHANIAALGESRAVRIIGSLEEKLPNLRQAPVAIGAFIGALALTTFGIVSFPIAVILGVLAVFLTKAITPEEAYREVEWKALILIASMLGVGRALEFTGAAQFIATQITQMFGEADPIWLLTAFFALTLIFTQPMSNQAAAVVIFPIALQTALQLDLNPRTFAMMIAVAASCSYLTPLEPSCLMVYGPGRYRFFDFFKVGFVLTILIYLIAITMVPMVWPLSMGGR
jgi:di/tricarboxylate transporter